MSENAERRIPWYVWPFWALWRLLTFLLNAVGRLVCVILGVALMVVGFTLAITVLGVPLGLALAILGFLLLVRALF